MTDCKRVPATHRIVQWFWRAVEQLTPEEKSLFVRFFWGRARLPRSQEDFGGRRFILTVLMDTYTEGSLEADRALPTAMTCFLMLKLPPYSCFQVLLEKLRYAIHFCKAIDTDNYARMDMQEVEDVQEDHDNP